MVRERESSKCRKGGGPTGPGSIELCAYSPVNSTRASRKYAGLSSRRPGFESRPGHIYSRSKSGRRHASIFRVPVWVHGPAASCRFPGANPCQSLSYGCPGCRYVRGVVPSSSHGQNPASAHLVREVVKLGSCVCVSRRRIP